MIELEDLRQSRQRAVGRVGKLTLLFGDANLVFEGCWRQRYELKCLLSAWDFSSRPRWKRIPVHT
jgi:hypothetical protein